MMDTIVEYGPNAREINMYFVEGRRSYSNTLRPITGKLAISIP